MDTKLMIMIRFKNKIDIYVENRRVVYTTG